MFKISHDALLWLCRWLSDCRSLIRSARCGSVRTGTCWVDAQWRRPGSQCSPVVLLGAGVDVGGSVDVDGGVKLWSQLECRSGEGGQTGPIGKPGPWMDPGAPVCPGYPVMTESLTFKFRGTFQHYMTVDLAHFLHSITSSSYYYYYLIIFVCFVFVGN